MLRQEDVREAVLELLDDFRGMERFLRSITCSYQRMRKVECDVLSGSTTNILDHYVQHKLIVQVSIHYNLWPEL